MNYTHIYEPLALYEYKEALSWYMKRSEVAAANFVKSVKERIEDICSDPLRYRNTYKHFRETSLKKYPFCIIYFIDDNANTIIITSIYHHKRSPRKKYPRLK